MLCLPNYSFLLICGLKCCTIHYLCHVSECNSVSAESLCACAWTHIMTINNSTIIYFILSNSCAFSRHPQTARLRHLANVSGKFLNWFHFKNIRHQILYRIPRFPFLKWKYLMDWYFCFEEVKQKAADTGNCPLHVSNFVTADNIVAFVNESTFILLEYIL
jgi:hypothetical protein